MYLELKSYNNLFSPKQLKSRVAYLPSWQSQLKPSGIFIIINTTILENQAKGIVKISDQWSPHFIVKEVMEDKGRHLNVLEKVADSFPFELK